MGVLTYDEIKKESLRQTAEQMMIAARTAPKGRGADHLTVLLLDEEDIQKLANKMDEIGTRENQHSFLRDAQNIRQADYILMLGSEIKPLNLKKCGLCGFKNCKEHDEHESIPCVFNAVDLGIAIGSAVSLAMDHRVDNRIMYTIGIAAIELNLFPEKVKIAFGVPLSATSKNPFFDRPTS